MQLQTLLHSSLNLCEVTTGDDSGDEDDEDEEARREQEEDDDADTALESPVSWFPFVPDMIRSLIHCFRLMAVRLLRKLFFLGHLRILSGHQKRMKQSLRRNLRRWSLTRLRHARLTRRQP